MERRAGIEPASLAWKARVIASIRTPRLFGFGINELGQNAKAIFWGYFWPYFWLAVPDRCFACGSSPTFTDDFRPVLSAIIPVNAPRIIVHLWFE